MRRRNARFVIVQTQRAFRDSAGRHPRLRAEIGSSSGKLTSEIDIPNMHFLPKPFSVAQIGEAVEGVLRRLRLRSATRARLQPSACATDP